MQNTGSIHTRRGISLLLAVLLVLTMLPFAAMAEGLQTGPALKDTGEIRWIDRLAELPEYAWEFYAWLEENSDGDGEQDALLDPTQIIPARENDWEYCVVEYEGQVPFTFEADQHAEAAKAAVMQAISAIDRAAVEGYITAVYNAFHRDHPEVFWLTGGSVIRESAGWKYSYNSSGEGEADYTLSFSFGLKTESFDIRLEAYQTAEAVTKAIDARNKAVETILSGLPQNGTRQEQLVYINEWLTQHNGYNTSEDLDHIGVDCRSCISALTGRAGTDGPVCEGYAEAFKVLCDALNIPCVLVNGLADNGSGSPEAHMWNYVQMEDGQWYAVDVTWNDPVLAGKEAEKASGAENTSYLLVGSATQIDGMRFADSHVANNRVSDDGVAFVNGPVLRQTAYGEAVIAQKGRSLCYEDMIYVIDIFELTNVKGVDLEKDAGLLVWSVEEFEALDGGIAFDSDHAKVGLKPYRNTGYYYGASDGILTAELAEEAYYVGYVRLDADTYIFSEARLYSPVIYAQNMLSKSSATKQTKTLCIALLNYISAVQKYFASELQDSQLVNAALTEEQKALAWDADALELAGEIPEEKQVSRDETVFKQTGKNLLFEEMIRLGALYQIDEKTVQDAKERGTIFWTAEQFAALEGKPGVDNFGQGTKAELAQYDGQTGVWASTAPMLAPKDMADTQYYMLGYVVHENGQVSYSGVMAYTVEQYIKNTVEDAEASAEMVELAKRLFAYERAAKAALKGN